MSKLIILTVLLIGSLAVSAASFPSQTVVYTTSSNLLSTVQATVNTNATAVTNYVEMNLYHTLQYTVTTNGVAQPVLFVADASLDSTNWIPKGTNSIAQTGGTSDLQIVGKYKFVRVRTTTTNATAKVDYLGGR